VSTVTAVLAAENAYAAASTRYRLDPTPANLSALRAAQGAYEHAATAFAFAKAMATGRMP
jgi:hypothetical protein